jgi:hypothetical protein
MQLRITAAGRAALINAQNTGTQATVISEVGITATAFDPAVTNTLPNEIKRISTFGGTVVDQETFHLNVVDDSSDTYTGRGILAYLDDGTEFAIGGDPDPANFIVQKSSAAQVMLSIDVKLTELTTATIEFSGSGFTNPPASETVLGVVRLANGTQAISGTNDTAVMTSSDTKQYVDNRFGESAPSALAKTLIAGETQTAVRLALGIKSAALRDEGHGNNLDADTLDGKHAAEFILATARGAAGGVADLDAGGRVPVARLPSIALVETYVVASQSAQLALSAQRGDVAVRSDINRSYIHNGGTAGTMADWTELRTPTDAVLSVAGRTGVIALAVADVGGLQGALDAKANLSGAAFTGGISAPTFTGTSAPPSSERYKEQIRDIDPSDAMQLLREIQFCWYRMRDTQQESAGVIAERLADTALDFVVLRDEEGRPNAVNYQPLFTIACAALAGVDRRLQALEDTRR